MTIITAYTSLSKGNMHGLEILSNHYPINFFWRNEAQDCLGAIILECGEGYYQLSDNQKTMIAYSVYEACGGVGSLPGTLLAIGGSF